MPVASPAGTGPEPFRHPIDESLLPRPLRATYRFQFGPGFSFDDAVALAPHLAWLEVSHVYASPIGLARSGSGHGYDGVDPTVISPELGGETGFRRMAAAYAALGIGILLDIVPNHMAADATNPYWTDCLEFGKRARFAPVFDIDWSRRIALPWLDGTTPPIGALRFDAGSGRILADVNGGVAPLRPASVAMLLDSIGEPSLVAAIAAWRALETEVGPPEVEAARDALRAAASRHGQAFDAALDRADRTAIHDEQHWRAVDWRAIDQINYRRFFNVSHLVGVRVEDDAVFDLVHRLPLALLREGLVDGFRVDHIDGLADPAAYSRRLRAESGPHAVLLLEKILGSHEDLRDWPVDGTTGYERINPINAVFVEDDGFDELEHFLRGHGLLAGEAGARIVAAKTEVLERSFTPEIEALVAIAADRLGEPKVDAADLHAAIVALCAAFPVYRSYIASLPADPLDGALWRQALARIAPELSPLAARIVEAVLNDPAAAAQSFRTRFQQLSGPAMAKGVEDTELYRSLILTSVNEVGSDPSAPRLATADLYARFARFAPLGLTPLATHDTKRGADTRARLNVLSHRAAEWVALFETWSKRHSALKAELDGAPAPDGLDEWFLYQTIFATWPIGIERIEAYFTKALREAKRHSSWEDPNEAYETALHDLARRLISGPEGDEFRRELEALLETAAIEGRINGLAQTILQLTLPGVPDIYQGTELWDSSLVDPDNRRPIDPALLLRLGDDLAALPVIERDTEGLSKALVIRQLLALRHHRPALFAGAYRAVEIEPPGWFGFARASDAGELLVAIPRSPQAQTTSELVFSDAPDLDGRWHKIVPDERTVDIADGAIEPDPAWPFLVLWRERKPA